MAAVKTGRIKRGARPKSSVEPRFLLKEGDWLDVLDGDGVWNVARVLNVPSPDKVKITYDGWPNDYDEVVSIDSHRVAPYHTFTWTVKCWVKYLNWPLWPSVVTFRSPGTTAGITNLAAENRLFVDFLDNPNFAKRDRCWQKKAHVRPFEENYDRKRTGSTGASFERALAWVLQSNASLKMPEFAAGTLPIEYKLCLAKSVETVRRDMEEELWFQNFLNNRLRHQMIHAYETLGCKEGDRSRKDSLPPALNKGLLDLSAMEVEPLSVSKEKKRPAGIRMDQNPRIGKEKPHELRTKDSSDGGSDIDDAQNTSQPNKRYLHTKRRSDGLSNTRKAKQEDLSPQMGKSSKSVAQLAVTKTKVNHSKGRTKMAAERRLQPVKLSADNGEVGKAQSVSSGAQLDTVPNQCAAAKRTKRLKKSELNAERQSVDLKKKETVLRSEQHLALGNVSRLERKGHSLSSTTSQGIFEPISPRVTGMESGRPQLPYLDVSRANVHRKEKSMKATANISKHSKELGCLLISASKIVSSANDELKNPSADNTARKTTTEKNGSIQEADSGVMGNCVERHHSTVLDADKHSTDDDGCSQELRRRFCVMQADQEDADATETVKCSKKTVISVPRKFKEISAPQMPTSCTDSMIGIAPPPRLHTMASCVQTSAALGAPSTKVFSSSNGFSMQSWIQRKLRTDFMGGGGT